MLLMIVIMAALLSYGLPHAEAPAQAISWFDALTISGAPLLALAILYYIASKWTLRRLGKADTSRLFRRMDRIGWVYRILVAKTFFVQLFYLGMLNRLNDLVHGLILVPKLTMILPTLAMMAWAWWCFYPIDRRLREASLIGRLDSGKSAPHIWTRTEFVLAQFRFQVGIVLLPLLLVLAWDEVLNVAAPRVLDPVGDWARPTAFTLGFLAVLVVGAPLLIRHIFQTETLPRGEVRDTLTAMCERHAIRVRDLLLWHTYGGMINAAVIGFFGGVRYILLTDALLESLPRRGVEAVMAHEIAHVRKHHMLWLLVAAVATWGLSFAIAMGTITGFMSAFAWARADTPGWVEQTVTSLGFTTEDIWISIAALVALVMWYASFGWVSRRFERQADTFAVQHLAIEAAEATRPEIHASPPPESSPEVVSELPPVTPLPTLAPTLTFAGGSEAFPLRSERPAGAKQDDPDGPDAPPRVDERSVETMSDALRAVAELNHIPGNRKSWRHGAINWRRQYLRTLVGQRVDLLEIDRTVWWINTASLIVLVALAVLGWFIPKLVQF